MEGNPCSCWQAKKKHKPTVFWGVTLALLRDFFTAATQNCTIYVFGSVSGVCSGCVFGVSDTVDGRPHRK